MAHARRSRPSDDSLVEMTEIILPQDTNHYGNAWGGHVMSLIDKAAAIAAVRHSRTNVVTASVDSLTFRAPVKLSHILSLHASVNAAFTTSMEVGVKVFSEDPLTGDRAHCCSAYVSLVSLNEEGSPIPVPDLIPRGREAVRRQRDAVRRRRARLALRNRFVRRAARGR